MSDEKKPREFWGAIDEYGEPDFYNSPGDAKGKYLRTTLIHVREVLPTESHTPIKIQELECSCGLRHKVEWSNSLPNANQQDQDRDLKYEYAKTLGKIAAMCWYPDTALACRNILDEVKRFRDRN